jgi:hypothetical protein
MGNSTHGPTSKRPVTELALRVLEAISFSFDSDAETIDINKIFQNV